MVRYLVEWSKASKASAAARLRRDALMLIALSSFSLPITGLIFRPRIAL